LRSKDQVHRIKNVKKIVKSGLIYIKPRPV